MRRGGGTPRRSCWYLSGISEGGDGRSLQATLDQQLAAHTAQLNAIGDAARFDYQRRLADFNIYATRRHDAIGAVYKALLDAEAEMISVDRFAHWSQLDENVDPERVIRDLESVGHRHWRNRTKYRPFRPTC